MRIPIKRFLEQINLSTIIIAGLTLILGYQIGWNFGTQDVKVQWSKYTPEIKVVNKEPPKNININFQLFWDTWNMVSQNYFDKKALDPNKMFYGAIQGMVAAIGDPYTMFLPPQQQKNSQEDLNGSFDGVGIHLEFNKDRRLVVVAPLEGSPAKKAGILPMDIIVKIDGKDTANMGIEEAVNLIRGPKSTQVTLTIYREGENDTRDFIVTRDTIVVKSVEVEYKNTASGKKIADIKLTRFGERTQDEWNQAVSDTLSQAPQGIILDLRNNPGGLLDGAVFIGSEFLNGGDVVLQEDNKGVRLSYPVNRQGKMLDLPMVVLFNKGSASASEIVAGALQDRKRAKLVGEKSFGKGTIQDAKELPGGTGIHITIAKWLTPLGRWVNATSGLQPDVEVKLTKDDIDNKRDPQLDKAVELLN